MHAIGSGALDAVKKIKALGICFICAFILRIVLDYALGILWDWHILPGFLYGATSYNSYAIVIKSWGWFI